MMALEFLPEKRFMLRALELARDAALAGEVPVGAVLVGAGKYWEKAATGGKFPAAL